MSFAFQLGQAILDGPDGRRPAPAARLRLPAATRPDPGSPEVDRSARFSWLLGMGNSLIVSAKGGRASLFHFENERCGRDRRRMSDTAGQIS
jgi:hypothetical protein